MASKKEHTMKSLNIPDTLVELIQAIADKEGRSFTAQAVRFLQQGADSYRG